MKIIEIWQHYGQNYEINTLLTFVLKLKRSQLYLQPERKLSSSAYLTFISLYQRLLKSEPLQYLVGQAEFMGRVFQVNPTVLIPRPETETLVKITLKKIKNLEKISILDLGTGSGNIIISLALSLKHPEKIEFIASDISKSALEVARRNAEFYQLGKRIRFFAGSLFKPLRSFLKERKLGVIISNPPYVAREEYEYLPPRVKNYEPRIALDGGERGVFFLEKIIKEAPLYLLSKGYLILEFDPRQKSFLTSKIRENKLFSKLEIAKDENGKERVIVATRK
jgi:release factor glutamine methyltransferase